MDFEITTALLKSGVGTEIFKQVCASTGRCLKSKLLSY